MVTLNNKSFYNKNTICLISAVFITSIGNGMHMLAMGKLLYDYTGSYLSFGGVILFEHIAAIFLQMIAGSIADRYDPKTISILVDFIRGATVILAGLLAFSASGKAFILFSLLVVSMAKPFFKASSFALISIIIKKEHLSKYYSMWGMCLQSGMLLGAAIAGPLIMYFGADVVFILDGATYLLSGLILLRLNSPEKIEKLKKVTTQSLNWLEKFINDWKEILLLLKKNKTLFWNLILTSVDFIIVVFVNLSLLPLVNGNFNQELYWFSAFDGAFALGAMCSPLIIGKIRKDWKTIAIFQSIQGLCFLMFIFSKSPYTTLSIFIIIGLANSLSLSVMLSSLQHHSSEETKGRIGGLRALIVALLAAIFTPILSIAFNNEINNAFVICSLIIFTFVLITFYLGKTTQEEVSPLIATSS